MGDGGGRRRAHQTLSRSFPCLAQTKRDGSAPSRPSFNTELAARALALLIAFRALIGALLRLALLILPPRILLFLLATRLVLLAGLLRLVRLVLIAHVELPYRAPRNQRRTHPRVPVARWPNPLPNRGFYQSRTRLFGRVRGLARGRSEVLKIVRKNDRALRRTPPRAAPSCVENYRFFEAPAPWGRTQRGRLLRRRNKSSMRVNRRRLG